MNNSSKIYLRLPESDDVDILLNWENDPNNAQFTSNEQGYTEQEILDFIDSNLDVQKNKQLRLMICDKKSESVVGAIDLYDVDLDIGSAGVGILIDPVQRRKGLGLSALKAMNHYASNDLDIKTLYCEIDVSNHPSINLFEKAGFEQVELRKNRYTIQSIPVDVYFYKKKI